MGYSKLAVGKFCTEPLRREPRLIFAMFAARLLRAVLAPLVYKGSQVSSPQTQRKNRGAEIRPQLPLCHSPIKMCPHGGYASILHYSLNKKRPRGRFCNIPNISSPHTPSSAFAKPK